MGFEAQCHCGAVGVAVEGEIPDKAVECNCSHCHAKGMLLAAVPGDSVTVTRGAELLRTYRFNNEVIDHRFCEVCGAQPLSQGRGSDGQPMAMINLRCVPGAVVESLDILKFDGASL